MKLTKLQVRVAQLMEEGHTIEALVARDVVKKRTLKTWDLEEMRQAYRRSIAMPPQDVEMELRLLAGQALHTLRACMNDGNPQTRLLAARYVLDAVRAQAVEGQGDDGGAVAELRELLSITRAA